MNSKGFEIEEKTAITVANQAGITRGNQPLSNRPINNHYMHRTPVDQLYGTLRPREFDTVKKQ